MNDKTNDKTKSLAMNWEKLLCKDRLGVTKKVETLGRSEFQRDFDRIIFSSAFRRLQDKTQVFPLAQNDYVRTRLTHSLEVASVGRSLGTKIGDFIIEKYGLDKLIKEISADDFGNIVASSCLAHDIGNPAFGHFGEEAIRSFFLENENGKEILKKVTEQEKLDLENFEGNAQGFRIITKLQNPCTFGGLQLTFASLAAFIKYPCTSKYINTKTEKQIASKKNGVLIDDLDIFKQIAKKTGLKQLSNNRWARHPLVFLTEAADDICYAIIDIEDAYQVRQISFEKAINLLKPLAGNFSEVNYEKIKSNSDKISYLRAKAIGNLVSQAVEVFKDKESCILKGELDNCLADLIPLAKDLKKLTNYASEKIYNCGIVVTTEIAGYRILVELMDVFCAAVRDISDNKKPKAISKMTINLIPDRFFDENEKNEYKRILGVIDFVSGMTDSYAVKIYQELTGIKL